MKNKIILLILHVISVCAFVIITGYSFYIKDTVAACFGIIAGAFYVYDGKFRCKSED